MRSVSLAAAKAGLSALLDAVEAGEEVKITRRGKTVARLVPDHSGSNAADQQLLNVAEDLDLSDLVQAV